MVQKQGVVYWKHLRGMNKETEGYIGISQHFEERMKQHYRDAFVRNSIYTVHENMRTHGDSIITDIIFEGNINDCFDLEEELRSDWNIGWNMAIGGGRPGSGWKPNPNWICNRLWHATYGEERINKDFTPSDLVRKYNLKCGGSITRLLRGTNPVIEGWELADLQLLNKVKERYHKIWQHMYIKNNETVVSVFKSGNSKFVKYTGYSPNSVKLKMLSCGSQFIVKGWELATKEEWLATKERIEFK